MRVRFRRKASLKAQLDLEARQLRDEEEHIDFLETQIVLVEGIGPELYSQRHIGELGED